MKTRFLGLSVKGLLLALVINLAVVLGNPATTLADPQQPTPADAQQKDDEKKKGSSSKEEQEYYELLRLFVDTLDQVDRNYVKDVSRRELMEAAIEGMVRKLDQYSNYIPPTQIDRFKTSVENEFGGIGIRVGLERNSGPNGVGGKGGDALIIISPLYGTPAYKAGLLAGDRITKINEESTKGFSLEDAVNRLKGKIGTSVTLTVINRREKEPRTVSIKRTNVQVETVLGFERAQDDAWIYFCDEKKKIGYICLTSFGRRTASELKKAMKELQEKEVRGLILDLRFNPGGLLASAIEISDLYISEGRIVSTEGRNVPKTVWDAHKAGTYGELPMVVLANRYSASASEIVSACLQDHDRAIVVGERTWGKGSVQNIISLEQGRSALKLTTAKYMRPSGKNIHRDKNAKPEDVWGVKPNDGYEVKYSNQELRNLETQRRDRLIVHNGQPLEKTEEPENAFIDRQLVKAIDYLLIKTDQKPATEEKEPKTEEKEEKADPEVETAAEPEGTSNTRPSRGRRGRRRP